MKKLAQIVGAIFWALLVVALVGAVAWWAWTNKTRPQGATWPAPVPVPATEVTLACPSPLPALSPQGQSQSEAVGVSEHIQVAGSTNFAVLARDGITPKTASFQPLHGEAVFLRPRSAALSGNLDKPTPGFLSVPPAAGKTPLAGAFVEQSVSGGDYRGLAAGACLRPSHEIFLVGGDTKLGSSTVLELLNPADSAVNAQVQVWGAEGALPLARGEKVVVKARSAVQIPLEAQVPEEERLVVRVSARGAGISAALRVHSLIGLVPGGVAVVSPGAGPAAQQVIPGLALSPAGGAVRLFNPAPKDHVNAAISVLSDSGEQPLNSGQGLDIGPGQVVDVPLSGLRPGNYGAVVNASGPLVAGAVIYREGQPSALDPSQKTRDQAWLVAAPEGDALAFGPQVVKRDLFLTNPTDVQRNAKVGTKEYPVPARSNLTVPLPEGETLAVALPGLRGAQIITTELGDGQGITALALVPDYLRQDQLYIHVNN